MTTLYVNVEDDKAEFFKKILHEMACVKSVEEYTTPIKSADKLNEENKDQQQ